MKQSIAHQVALGGILAALAMVIMCLVGLIPVATFICPMFCVLICAIVYRNCGKRIGYAWYGTVSFMSLFLAPDKEAALLFLFLGYYPMLKVCFDKSKLKLGFLYKLIFFNCVILFLYLLVLKILGLTELLEEYWHAGLLLGFVTVILGNIAFLLMDFVLKRILYTKAKFTR